ncbi:acyltransferase family protein [Mucilaginibacter paludis]|uniref:Acyltransferase 3 n=1 Tax=Mucilaginibacter paludis DSM 18603 TaxID=714943 RepID=H1YC86_9SPHI|nr:acyltransferase [Mucilaginibacter paludis]EHQ30077.1 acyltransferase 3 [Mucilaginibacter paludis DSM 18603]
MRSFSGKFNGLDHLRAVAILLVLTFHYRMFGHPDWVDTYGGLGWTGVDLFFVLSGFLISNKLFSEIKKQNTINLKVFFAKRLFRIIPPYLLTVLLYFCFPVIREKEALPPLWKFITFTQNYGLNLFDQGTFSHAWSLCIEEQFYLLIPFSLLLLIKTKTFRYIRYIILILIVISISARYITWQKDIVPLIPTDNYWKEWYMKIYYPTYTRLDGLAMGVLTGYLFQYSAWFKKFIASKGNLLFIVGIIMLGFSFWFCSDQVSPHASTWGFTLVALSYTLLVMAAISESCFLYRTKLFATSQLASLSYALYLSHKFVIHIIQNILKQMQIQVASNVTLIICLTACIITALIYRYTVENISAKIKNKLIHIKN